MRVTSPSSRIRYLLSALIALGAAAVAANRGTVSADGDLPVLESHSITSEFPEGFRIEASATSEKHDVTGVAIRLKIGQQTTGVYNYLDERRRGRNGGRRQDVFKLFWNTNSGQNYIPPGTIITYNFEVEDSAGNRLETEPLPFIYYDARFVDEDGNSHVGGSVGRHGDRRL